MPQPFLPSHDKRELETWIREIEMNRSRLKKKFNKEVKIDKEKVRDNVTKIL